MNVDLGRVVISRAGRDAGRKFVIVNVIDHLFVEIADGRLRRIEKPKKKKIRHLSDTGDNLEGLGEKLKSNAKVTNSEIRKALSGLKIHKEQEQGQREWADEEV